MAVALLTRSLNSELYRGGSRAGQISAAGPLSPSERFNYSSTRGDRPFSAHLEQTTNIPTRRGAAARCGPPKSVVRKRGVAAKDPQHAAYSALTRGSPLSATRPPAASGAGSHPRGAPAGDSAGSVQMDGWRTENAFRVALASFSLRPPENAAFPENGSHTRIFYSQAIWVLWNFRVFSECFTGLFGRRVMQFLWSLICRLNTKLLTWKFPFVCGFRTLYRRLFRSDCR